MGKPKRHIEVASLLDSPDAQVFHLPKDTKFLDVVSHQGNVSGAYVFYTTRGDWEGVSEVMDEVTFLVLPTGHDIPRNAQYLGSVVMADMMHTSEYHVFAVTKEVK